MLEPKHWETEQMSCCHPSVNNILKREVGEGKETRSSGSSVQHGVAALRESLETLANVLEPFIVPLPVTAGIFLFFILWKVKGF